MCQSSAFIDVKLVSDGEAIVIVLLSTREALDDLSNIISVLWFAENVMYYLSDPVQGSVGEVVVQVVN